MESKRQRQIAEIIKRHFSQVLQQEGPYVYGAKPLVTVTEVKVTPDMSMAKIYLSIWNTENKQAVLLQMAEEHQRLKQAMASRVKRHLRRLPDLSYYEDETLDEMYKIDNMFDRLYDENQMPKGEEE
jgi:ribosome-binding factor A